MRRGTLRLALVGDIMLGRLVAEVLPERGLASLWGASVLDVLAGADLRLGNLECALTDRDEEWHDGRRKMFYFRAPPAFVVSLKIAGFDFVSLANNHAGDFGMAGLLDTVSTLEAAGIAHAGAGRDLDAAFRAALLTAQGWRVAVVAFADYPPEWAASATSAGINYIPVPPDAPTWSRVKEAISAARVDADLVVFSIHWGPNMTVRPSAAFRRFARSVIDAGADLFWGHSAHVPHGIEIWNAKPILYDTGDFVDDYAIDPVLRNDLSAIFLVDMRPTGVTRVSAVPVVIDNMRVDLAQGNERDWMLDRITSASRELGSTPVQSARNVLFKIPSAPTRLSRMSGRSKAVPDAQRK